MHNSLTAIIERLAGAPLQLQIHLHDVGQIPLAVAVFGIGLVHVLAWARIAQRTLAVRFDQVTSFAAYLAAGFAGFGFYIWLLGYLHLLSPSAFAASTCVFAAFLGRDAGWRRGTIANLGELKVSIANRRLSWSAISLIIAVALISGLRDFHWVDDWDYHWQSPQAWAAAGHWVASPYRLSNGPAMAEWINVLPAVFDSPAGGNWLATLMWIICALCAAALVQPMKVPAPIAMLACCAIPIFTADAASMNSDVQACCFALAAFVFLLRGDLPASGTESAARKIPRRAFIAAGIMLAAVYATKFIVLGCFPVALWIVISRCDFAWRARLRGALLLGMPLLLVLVLGMFHTIHMIGRPLDGSGKFMARDQSDWRYTTGTAAGRIPTVRQLLRLPIEPWVTTLWGKREPYGGRTGVLWPIMLPIALYVGSRGWMRGRKMLKPLLLIAGSTFLLIGTISLKTRFMMLVFLMLAALGAVAYARRDEFGPVARKVVACAFITCCAIDISFGCRKLLLGVVLELPDGRQVAMQSHPDADE